MIKTFFRDYFYIIVIVVREIYKEIGNKLSLYVKWNNFMH